MKTLMAFIIGVFFIIHGLMFLGYLPAVERWHNARYERTMGSWRLPTVTIAECWWPLRRFLNFMGAIVFLAGCFAVIVAFFMLTQ